MSKLKFNFSTSSLIRSFQSANQSVSLCTFLKAVQIQKTKRACNARVIKIWGKFKALLGKCARITKSAKGKGANK